MVSLDEIYLCIVLNAQVLLWSVFIMSQCCKGKRRRLKDDDGLNVEPKERKPQTEVEKAAVEAIEQGQMREANDNETIEDAVSNWGKIQKIEASGMTNSRLFPWNDVDSQLDVLRRIFHMDCGSRISP
uniref:Uncharacterized protein n=1 Tax=Parascaris univalens TaxID=6257 RepID=A0A914ZXQ4_PARUN